ncbi:conserved hypothetical protein [Leishmania braziliensis MHOM/BR/75/M2904]|uniref:Uncharacterized protein n=1 Tax=Leishmania braziliensis TaxID=5660 RepID=A4H4H1_LEIBR|nr:conserved hypothetical protein [Leishmania braziliensis MHOM/BR/75/M2904]CAJ2466529.1 unnamed protein product [Leishmania braziliensis]CAM36961.2 conserved hypothetical protein [Leishmania braziliensis MHOM/BR/75/M2904]
MAKQKITVKVKGKSVSYEGHPERRPRDLMDILIKMAVSESAVVATFRENIDNHNDFSDEQVMSMFKEAKMAREKKERSKGGSSSAEAAAPASAPAASTEEKPQKIILTYCGKQLSYQGVPSGKRSAVLQLLSKQPDVTQPIAVETFRTNLPDETASDDEIWRLVEMLKERRKAKGQSKSGAGESGSGNANHAAVEDLVGMSDKERNDLNDFIRQVLGQPTVDAGSLFPNDSRGRNDGAESPERIGTARKSGKVTVYLQEGTTNATKLISATLGMSFSEFSSIVDKKFGHHMLLSFCDGDDVLEVDDDDVLNLYFEKVVEGDAKKERLICTNPEDAAKDGDDQLQDARLQSAYGAQVVATQAKVYSNGELTVTEDRTYTGHTLAVYCCCFSPRGDMFLTASRDRTVRLWNVRTGGCTLMKGGHNGFVLSCDFSPKGNRVVSSSDDRTIKLWSTSSCNKVATFKGHEDKVYCVKYNPSGDYIVSGSCDNTVRVWNAESQSKLATLKGHSLAVFSCAFSNTDNGKYVVSGSDDRTIKVWDWGSGRDLKTLVGHIGTVWSVVFSHNDKYIVSGSMDYELILWDTATGSRLRSMDGHKTSVHHAIFSEDDKYIFSCSRDWSVMVWRTCDGEHVETIMGHLSTVYHMDIKNNKLLTSSLDDKVKVWTIKYN